MSNPNEQLDPASIFSMSPDELSKFDVDAAQEAAPADEPEQQQEQPQQQETTETTETTQEDTQEPDTTTQPAEETQDTPDETTQNTEQGDPNLDQGNDAPDYKELYSRIVGKPFKANGKDLTIQTPEEAVQLMQMGANYHEKMAAMKPVRRVARMLQEAGLMDEQQIGFLIDLHNKNPEAIAKLIQDSKIDVMDIDTETPSQYKTAVVAPTDEQLNLEETINTLRVNPGFQEMLDGIVQGWDKQSQDFIVNNPGILNVFQQANASGEYDQVMSEVARRRMFNPALQGIPVLQLYRDVDAEFRTAGKFTPKVTPQQTRQAEQAAIATAAQLKQQNPVNNRRQAAAAPRTAPQVQKQNYSAEDMFSLSEEEFAKIDPSKFN